MLILDEGPIPGVLSTDFVKTGESNKAPAFRTLVATAAIDESEIALTV